MTGFILQNQVPSSSTKCNSIIIIQVFPSLAHCNNFFLHTFATHVTEIDAILWKLPKYPNKVYGVFSVFSAGYGLFGIGGKNHYQISDIYNLPIGVNRDSDLKWKEIGRLSPGRCYTTCAMIKNKDETHKLMIVGGQILKDNGDVHHNGSRDVELFDIESNGDAKPKKLQECNKGRFCAGIKYWEYSQRVYVAGGCSWTRSVEYYDITKDTWLNLPDTQNGYNHNPTIWLTDHNILNISCMKYMECIDLRVDKKTWQMIDNSFCDKLVTTGNRAWAVHSS